MPHWEEGWSSMLQTLPKKRKEHEKGKKVVSIDKKTTPKTNVYTHVLYVLVPNRENEVMMLQEHVVISFIFYSFISFG